MLLYTQSFLFETSSYNTPMYLCICKECKTFILKQVFQIKTALTWQFISNHPLLQSLLSPYSFAIHLHPCIVHCHEIQKLLGEICSFVLAKSKRLTGNSVGRVVDITCRSLLARSSWDCWLLEKLKQTCNAALNAYEEAVEWVLGVWKLRNRRKNAWLYRKQWKKVKCTGPLSLSTRRRPELPQIYN